MHNFEESIEVNAMSAFDKSLNACLVLLLAAGCGGNRFAGYWEGQQDLKAPNAYQGTGRVSLEVERDGRCGYTRFGLTYDGTVQEAEGKLILVLKKTMGRPVLEGELRVPLTISQDGSLILADGDSPPEGIRLQRKEKPTRTD